MVASISFSFPVKLIGANRLNVLLQIDLTSYYSPTCFHLMISNDYEYSILGFLSYRNYDKVTSNTFCYPFKKYFHFSNVLTNALKIQEHIFSLFNFARKWFSWLVFLVLSSNFLTII